MSEIYQTALLKLAGRATGAGRLDNPDGTATVQNPMCGDRITLDVNLSDDGTIAEVAYEARACLVCQASASVLGKAAQGKSPAELDGVAEGLDEMLKNGGDVPAGDDWSDYGSFDAVIEHPSRHTCVLLPYTALRDAVDKTGK